MKKIFFQSFVGCSLTAFTRPPAYKNQNLSPEQRAKDLLSRMTLDEKFMQAQCIWPQNAQVPDSHGNFNKVQASLLFKNELAPIARLSEKKSPEQDSSSPRQQAEVYSKLQKFFIAKIRLGIPEMICEGSLHGQQALDAANFQFIDW